MAWAETFQPASFRGVRFEVERVAQQGSRSVAVHQVPFRNGAAVDDLGLLARRIGVRAVFFGADYESRLKDFLTALEAPGAGELVHPIWGKLRVVAFDWAEEHQADLVDGAEVTVNFVEDAGAGFDQTFAQRTFTSRADAVASAAAAARVPADEAVVRRVQAVPTLAFPRITVLRDLVTQARTALTGLLNTTGLRALLSDLDPLLYPRAYVADLRAIVDRAFQGLPLGGRNPAYGAVAMSVPASSTLWGDWTRGARLMDPALAVLTPQAALVDADMAGDAAVLQAHTRIHMATGMAELAATVLASQADTTDLTRAQIEALTGQARTALQLAMDGTRNALPAEWEGRTIDGLRQTADALQETARALIATRPQLVLQPAPAGGPARLLAHLLYNDAARADELALVNRLGRKVLLDAGDPLEVYRG